jgi:hypothetical protein
MNSLPQVQAALNYFVEDEYKMEVDCLAMRIDNTYGKTSKVKGLQETLEESVFELGNLYESEYWTLSLLKEHVYNENCLPVKEKNTSTSASRLTPSSSLNPTIGTSPISKR